MSDATTDHGRPVGARPASAAPTQTAAFVAPEHLTPATLDRLHTWYHGEEQKPLALRNFLLPELATSLAAALRAIPAWDRHAAIYEGRLKKTEFWGEDVEHDPRITISQFIVRDINALLDDGAMDAAHQKTLEQFMVFSVLSDALRGWIKAGTGLELRRRTVMELAAYRDSDALGAHQDLVPGRVMAVNFYLDEDYRPEHDGRLGFRDGKGTESHVTPLFNTVSLMPIREDCWHWVEPFAGDRVGRYTIAIGQHLEGS
ncbi:hypothetical protein J7F03_28755 [Streptomyces sp. ISL-43]|uniref:2OG-Fe(II) oxygenase n=1 Tax=Streptomyces sp. ISL-43 TaxID=2819183 RepID=UPI001BE9F6AD|nr:2OG-Fe(II) oxygenase [Streptomyces sp. ISL-43]MBT2450996.1 hypothetical protein [Streptomyces sp. ISL-43]